MSPHTLRHPGLVVGVVAALGAGSVAPAAVAASTTPPPSSAAQRGLLDGLTPALQSLLTGLTTDPAATLSPQALATLLADIPKITADTVGGVLDALTGDQLAQLLAAATTAAPTAVAALVDGLVDTVTDIVSGAAAGSPPSTDEATAALQQLLAVLQSLTPAGGGAPTLDDAGLTSLTALLAKVSEFVGLPGVAALPIVSDVVGALRGLGTALPGPLGAAVSEVIEAVTTATTPGTATTPTTSTTPATANPGFDPAAYAALLAYLGAAGASGAGSSASGAGTTKAPAAKKVPRARISSLKVNRTRTRITIRILCPATAPAAGCKVITSAKLAGKATKVTRRITVRRGATRALKAKVPAALARRVRRTGGKAVVRVGTSGTTGGALAKTVKVRRLAR